METERDYDDGHLEYEVQFWVDSTKYEYKIDGGSGAVLESEKEEHGRSQPESASEADDIGGRGGDAVCTGSRRRVPGRGT